MYWLEYAKFNGGVHFFYLFIYLDWKYPFLANLNQKIKIVNLSWNLVPRLIWICIIQWCCSFFLFLTGNTLLWKIFPLKLKFGTKNFKYTEFISRLLFSDFDQIYSFWVKLVQKIKIVSLTWNLVPWLIQICRIH